MQCNALVRWNPSLSLVKVSSSLHFLFSALSGWEVPDAEESRILTRWKSDCYEHAAPIIQQLSGVMQIVGGWVAKVTAGCLGNLAWFWWDDTGKGVRSYPCRYASRDRINDLNVAHQQKERPSVPVSITNSVDENRFPHSTTLLSYDIFYPSVPVSITNYVDENMFPTLPHYWTMTSSKNTNTGKWNLVSQNVGSLSRALPYLVRLPINQVQCWYSSH